MRIAYYCLTRGQRQQRPQAFSTPQNGVAHGVIEFDQTFGRVRKSWYGHPVAQGVLYVGPMLGAPLMKIKGRQAFRGFQKSCLSFIKLSGSDPGLEFSAFQHFNLCLDDI